MLAEISAWATDRSTTPSSPRSSLIEGAYFHRAYPNGSHTCLAGRGSAARQMSIGYFEQIVQSGGANVRSLVCVGPEHDFKKLTSTVEKEGKKILKLVDAAAQLTAIDRKKPAAIVGSEVDLRAPTRIRRGMATERELSTSELGIYRHPGNNQPSEGNTTELELLFAI